STPDKLHTSTPDKLHTSTPDTLHTSTPDKQNTSTPDKLRLASEKLSWRDALYYCRARRMDLVSVVSSEILYWVKKLAKDASTDHVWLGLYYLSPLDVWLWVNGETVCSTLWDEG